VYTTKREAQILDAVRLRRSCSIGELASQLEVSDETIRRSIRPLVERGLVLRVHGGIVLPDPLQEPPFLRRMQESRAAKQRIAALAARQVHDGDSLILDNGSTTAYLALALAGHANLVIVTNSAEIARMLATRNGNRVYMAGGELRADDAAAFGPAAHEFVEQFEVQHAFLSVGAISVDNGFMDFHLCEAEFSRVAMRRAERVMVIADSSKFGRKGFVRVCGFESVDLLVTDAVPPPDLSGGFRESELQVLVAN
jgi:DeoR family glycerol-3-phosphate regulon repressor